MSKPAILVCTQYYLPGYKAGGPIRTLANMVAQLSDSFKFKIITTDRDSGDESPYEDITANDWNQVAEAEVFYCSPQNRSALSLRRIICNTSHDLLYLNSFFQPRFTIQPLLLRRLGFIPNRPTILAPRGEFSKGAIALKERKKRLYIRLAKILKLYKDLLWQVSSEKEEDDIRREFDRDAQIVVTSNVPSVLPKVEREKPKVKGELDVLYLSRITPKKNLTYVLNVLEKVDQAVSLSIYGPIDSKKYWQICAKKINRLTKNINVNYMGSVEHHKVPGIMSSHDLFFLPTRGENFGHVILEALSAGCPVMISDQTPWQGLEEKGVGYDLPLDRSEAFCRILQRFVDMEESTHQKWRRRARELGRTHQKDRETVEKNIQLFQQALKGT